MTAKWSARTGGVPRTSDRPEHTGEPVRRPADTAGQASPARATGAEAAVATDQPAAPPTRRTPGPLDPAALAGGVAGATALAPLLDLVLESLAKGTVERGGPTPAGSPAAIAAAAATAVEHNPLPDKGIGAEPALAELSRLIAVGSADPADPRCAGHLHCPPLAIAVAAEVAAGAMNQSLDSWDQAPVATELEPWVVRALAELVGFQPDQAGGVLTSGGTESNLMGLLLAREFAPTQRPRVYCSAAAHFSVQRNAGILGLGEDAVVAVPVTADQRMDPIALVATLMADRAGGHRPIAVIATAGTTDFGVIDPLPELAAIANAHDAWFHVDAAYGGGALFSDRLAPLLRGLDLADSIAIDLHKFGWQPVAAGGFLTRRASAFDPLTRRVAYLNPTDDEDLGYRSLLGYSLRTTRRLDALKLAVTFRALGRTGLGVLVDACHDLARHAATAIDAHPRLVLAARPVLSTVVFHFQARHGDPDQVNAALRRRLLAEGSAVVGRTEVDGRIRLKLTLLNPHATTADLDALLALVVEAGEAEDTAEATG
ncbi:MULTISPECIES: pyridoxal-dependent decarboxylase [unclassified Crossiella]|uniref:pyridoxal phosphate-dependent decarboxylase family protein n=1 Tax=unclassified Crossiella TaxID=2620835 RepID=UPI001FFF7EE2|nr:MULTISPECIES: pyridoxal-dependent decarboxylase [unclassified Crossiella]MCK2239870.1 pyridoxal-dependent decarboxylase [Crossiella sp. S99.2]MCK2252578.1 pyridoxal-dependent decarboxylase [Crossiella sp. S99.1]